MFRLPSPSPPSGQSDAEPARVFVSYAREDTVFKDRIVEALRLRGVDVRGDWQLIRGEDYETQLEALQLTSDVLIFVLSPDSFRSQACRAELDRAAVQNKPIFPLVHRDLAADQENNLPAPLKAPQWAFLRAGDDFVAGVQGLVDAINTDFDLLPPHRRLLQAAEAWDRNGRSASYVLRRQGLLSAEEWLARATRRANALPQPTPLQVEFVRASRAARARASRIALFAAGGIAVAMAALAVVAFLQRNEARRESTIALARALAVQAQSILDREPDRTDRALLLAAESLKRFASTEADQVVRAGLPLLPKVVAVLRRAAEIDAVALTSDGRKLAALSNGEVSITALTGEIGVGPRVINVTRHGGRAMAIGLSPDGKYLVTGATDNLMTVVELESGRELATMQAQAQVERVLVTPDSRFVIGLSRSSVVDVWTLPEGRAAAHLAHEKVVRSISLSPDGFALCTGTGNGTAPGTVSVWDWKRQRLLGRFEAAAPVLDVACGPNGLVAATDETADIRIWSPGERTPRTLHIDDRAGHVAFDHDGHHLAASANESIFVWNTASWGTPTTFRQKGPIQSLAFQPSGVLLATAGLDNTARLWDTATGHEVYRIVHLAPVVDIAFDGEGRLFATASIDATARVVNVAPNEISWYLEGAHFVAAAYSPTGRFLATADRTGEIVIWNTAQRRQTKLRIPAAEGHRLERLAFSVDERHLAIAETVDGRGEIRIVSLGDGSTRSWRAHDGPIAAIAFSPDARELATGGADKTVRFWTIDGEPLGELKQPDDVHAVAFSHNHRLVAAGIGSFRERHWNGVTISDPDAGRIISQTGGVSASVEAVSFSPDDAVLAFGGQDSAAHVWDVRRQHERVAPLLHDRPVYSVAFSSDGHYLATGCGDATARVWDLVEYRELARAPHRDVVRWVGFGPNDDQMIALSYGLSGGPLELRPSNWRPLDMIREVCSRVDTSLSKNDRRRYLEPDPRDPACPP